MHVEIFFFELSVVRAYQSESPRTLASFFIMLQDHLCEMCMCCNSLQQNAPGHVVPLEFCFLLFVTLLIVRYLLQTTLRHKWQSHHSDLARAGYRWCWRVTCCLSCFEWVIEKLLEFIIDGHFGPALFLMGSFYDTGGHRGSLPWLCSIASAVFPVSLVRVAVRHLWMICFHLQLTFVFVGNCAFAGESSIKSAFSGCCFRIFWV